MVKALHLFFTLLILGGGPFSLALVLDSTYTHPSSQTLLRRHALKLTLFGLALILLIGFTGLHLIPIYGWQLTTPWIVAAIFSVLLLMLLFLAQAWLYYRPKPLAFKPLLIIQAVIFLIFIMSLRDAILKQSWF
jgi:hypothetical protein